MSEAVLFANEAFYRAFADRDAEAMDEIWSRTAPVACVHPGWGPLYGREAVMRSWFAIIRNAESPAIRFHDARAVVHGDSACVLCFEEIDENWLVATNAFVREGSLWKMVHHHSGPTAARPEIRSDDTRAVVN